MISIHALREEGDQDAARLSEHRYKFLSTPSARRATEAKGGRGGQTTISIHALREEGDVSATSGEQTRSISIHALREEGDAWISKSPGVPFYFYPRPPRGGRPLRPNVLKWSCRISIHALREEGDQRHAFFHPVVKYFYPRPPRGGRLFLSMMASHVREISIHALREEGDQCNVMGLPHLQDFYPRPPRGGRQQKQRQNLYFQTNYTTFCTNLEEP